MSTAVVYRRGERPSGSPAEERIRAKAEAFLRRMHPTARIIHELVLRQSVGPRLDLAAVTEDSITLVEIKSERDTLKRLRSQIEYAVTITKDVHVFATEHHRAQLDNAHEAHLRDADGRHLYPYRENPDQIAALRTCKVWIEQGEQFGLCRVSWPTNQIADPRNLFELLHASEMRWALRFHCLPVSLSDSRPRMKEIALEYLSGREIRRAVCTCLRSRPFARADLPLKLEQVA